MIDRHQYQARQTIDRRRFVLIAAVGIYMVLSSIAISAQSYTMRGLITPFGLDLLRPATSEKLKAHGARLNAKGEWEALDQFFPIGTREAAFLKSIADSGSGDGFYFDRLQVGSSWLRGRWIPIDKDGQICENGLFSKRPLKTAEFVIIIFDEKSTKSLSKEEATIAVAYRRKGTKLYETLIKP